MEKLTLIYVPDPRLSKPSEYVTEVNAEIKEILQRMLKTIHVEDGIAMAAAQAGIMKRLVVIDIDGVYPEKAPTHGGKTLFMVNPEVVEQSEEQRAISEGCMSIPGVYVDVPRPKAVKVKYLDENGAEQFIEADNNLLAACLQHEIDHTNGILIIDRLSPLKRDMQIKKVVKQLKNRDAS